MNRTTGRFLIILASYLAVLYPVWARLSATNWAMDRSIIANLFPLFGIIAFTLLWLHIVGPSVEPWLRKYIDFEWFIENTSILILVFVILHPLLLLIDLGFSLSAAYQIYSPTYLTLAIVGWLLLITYDIGRALKKKNFFIRHWQKILLISTIGFLLTFFHSISIGSDLQEGPLRILWIFYGVTAIASTIFNYLIKPLTKK